MQPEQYDKAVEQANRSADSVIRHAQEELGLTGAQTRVLQGDPGAAICQLAAELSARAIVVGCSWPRWTEAGVPWFRLRSRRAQCALFRDRNYGRCCPLLGGTSWGFSELIRTRGLVGSMRTSSCGGIGPIAARRACVTSLVREGVSPLPSLFGIYRALLRHCLIEPKARRKKLPTYKRLERGRPMELWQMDVVGGVLPDDGTECKGAHRRR